MIINELHLGPLGTVENLSIAANELEQKQNEVIRNLLELASAAVTEEDLQQLQTAAHKESHYEDGTDELEVERLAGEFPWARISDKPELGDLGGSIETSQIDPGGEYGVLTINGGVPSWGKLEWANFSVLLQAMLGVAPVHVLNSDRHTGLLGDNQLPDGGTWNLTAPLVVTGGGVTFQGSVVMDNELDVAGNVTGEQLISTASSGLQPLVVNSPTLVPNLNVEMLGGQNSAYHLSRANHTGLTPVAGGGTGASAFAANRALMGPTSGADAAPTIRALVSDDIPALDWAKIGSGKPTTLAGYGITDAASDSELAAHEADALGVHGITDTAQLVTRNTAQEISAFKTFVGNAGTSDLLGGKIAAEAGLRWMDEANGDRGWADGTGAAPDTEIGRLSAGVLSLKTGTEIRAPTLNATSGLIVGGTTSTTVGAAGGAAALPATPTGYLIVTVAGTNRKFPFFAV
jgi:hypothetical protein